MANKYQVVDEILKGQGQGTYTIAFAELNVIHEDDEQQEQERVEVVGAISEAVRKSIQLKYDDLKVAPAIPDEGVATSATHPADDEHDSAWTEVTAYNAFDKIAFTGNYSDLQDAPGIPEEGYDNGVVKDFDPIAFTGIQGSGSVVTAEVLDLRPYNNQVLSTFGSEDAMFEGWYNNQNLINNGILLSQSVLNFATSFDGTGKGKKNYYIITNAPISGLVNSGTYSQGKVFQVLNVFIEKYNGMDYSYFKFDVANVNASSYPYEIGVKGQAVLDSIEIDSKVGCFIFDIDNNIAYCKLDNVNSGAIIDVSTLEIDASQVTGLKSVATSGSYNDLSNTPELETVAISGSYNDLQDKPEPDCFIFNIAEFNQAIQGSLTERQLNGINNLGTLPCFVRSFSNIQDSEEHALIEQLDLIYSNYEKNHIILFLNQNTQFLVNKVNLEVDDEVILRAVIELSPSVIHNYNSLLSMPTGTNDEIEAVLDDIQTALYFSYLIIDYQKDIIYSKVFGVEIVDITS